MSGRRSHVRFTVLQSPEGMLRVLQDVVIQNALPDHTIAISRDPGVLGELVSVRFPLRDGTSIWARVLESQPLVVDGRVRHRLRLHHLGEASVEGQDVDEAVAVVSQ